MKVILNFVVIYLVIFSNLINLFFTQKSKFYSNLKTLYLIIFNVNVEKLA